MNDDDEILDTQEEVIETTESVETEKTMDDTIRETLEKIESRNGGEEQEEEKQDKRKSRERGPDGKYLPKPDAAPQDDSEAPIEAESTPPVEAAPTVPPELQRLGLRKEEAEAIATNPVAMQAFIRRSEEMHRGLEQYRQKAQFGDQMVQALQPFSQTIQALGVHPAQAVYKLMNADNVLRNGSPEQKQAAAFQLLREYGIQLDEGQQPYVDPNVHGLQQQVQQLQSWILSRNQQEQQREQAELNSQIAKFASDPANTYFESVRNEMAGLLQAGIASDLKDAYEKAIYANPTIRSQVLAKQQAEEQEKRKADANRKAQDAKRAASVNVPRKGTMNPAKPIGSMEDTIKAEAERLGIY